jgi:hypothetical protein
MFFIFKTSASIALPALFASLAGKIFFKDLVKDLLTALLFLRKVIAFEVILLREICILIEPTDKDTPVKESTELSVPSSAPDSDHIYVLVHNGRLKHYIQDETLLDSKIQCYMRQVFQEYISRWDAFNFNVVTQEGICCPESGVVKRIRLMSRARYLLGLHEQIEEEIDIYKISALPSQDDEESDESSESEGETEEHEEVNSS